MSIDPRIRALAPDGDPELWHALRQLLDVYDLARDYRAGINAYSSPAERVKAGERLDAAIVLYTEQHP